MGTKEMTLGQALQEWRLAGGFETQAKAAIALSARSGKVIREKDVSRWETGSAQPRTWVLILMAQVYGPAPWELADLTTDYGPLALIGYSRGLPPALMAGQIAS